MLLQRVDGARIKLYKYHQQLSIIQGLTALYTNTNTQIQIAVPPHSTIHTPQVSLSEADVLEGNNTSQLQQVWQVDHCRAERDILCPVVRRGLCPSCMPTSRCCCSYSCSCSCSCSYSCSCFTKQDVKDAIDGLDHRRDLSVQYVRLGPLLCKGGTGWR